MNGQLMRPVPAVHLAPCGFASRHPVLGVPAVALPQPSAAPPGDLRTYSGFRWNPDIESLISQYPQIPRIGKVFTEALIGALVAVWNAVAIAVGAQQPTHSPNADGGIMVDHQKSMSGLRSRAPTEPTTIVGLSPEMFVLLTVDAIEVVGARFPLWLYVRDAVNHLACSPLDPDRDVRRIGRNPLLFLVFPPRLTLLNSP